MLFHVFPSFSASLCLTIPFFLQWHFLCFFSPCLHLFPSTYLLLFLLLLPASWTETPRENRWKWRERKREWSEKGEGNRWRQKVCCKVPQWVEHGHLSWGWKLKKRLVNLYSWSPWDTGKKHSPANHLQEEAAGTCTRMYAHILDWPLQHASESRIDSGETVSREVYMWATQRRRPFLHCFPLPDSLSFPSAKSLVVSVVFFLPPPHPPSLSPPHPARVINHLVLMSC